MRPLPPMELSEFLAWDAGDGQRYELVNGEPVAMAPAARDHGYLQNELGAVLRNHLRARGSECDVISHPGIVPRLLTRRNVRTPDLAVTCAPSEGRQLITPEPVLLIEILSPNNAAKTWSNVWAYTSIPSVQEIAVLDSEAISAEVLRLDKTGLWPESPERIGADGTLSLRSVGFEIAMTALYARTRLGRQ